MRRIFIIAVVIASLIIATASYVLLTRGSEPAYDRTNSEFLSGFGWEVKLPAAEYAQIHIPEVFDDVYLNYNIIQTAAGLDLTPYRGSDAVRYTYIVTNFPDSSDEVRANVICVNGKPVAGDIMTVSLGGFMHPLNCRQNSSNSF